MNSLRFTKHLNELIDRTIGVDLHYFDLSCYVLSDGQEEQGLVLMTYS